MQLAVTELGAISINMCDERAQLREVRVLRKALKILIDANGYKRQNVRIREPPSIYGELYKREDMLRGIINRRVRSSKRRESFYNRSNTTQKIQYHRNHADGGDRTLPIQNHLLKLHEH